MAAKRAKICAYLGSLKYYDGECFYMEPCSFTCGLCGKECQDGSSLETDDYVSNNCLYWCSDKRGGGCGEVLVCVTAKGNKSDPIVPSFDNIADGVADGNTDGIADGCSKNISVEHEDEWKISFETGILRLLFVLPSEHDDGDENMLEKVESYFRDEALKQMSLEDRRSLKKGFHLPKDIWTFAQAREATGDDLTHDGCNVYYVAECSCCGRLHKGFIYGD